MNRPLPRVRAAKQLSAIRTGSSLPGVFLIEGGADMVVKLRGAGAWVRALAVEIVVASLAEAFGLEVPARAIVEIGAGLPSLERHEEVLELLSASVGENLGFAYLPRARVYSPGRSTPPDAERASRIVVFDTLVMNVDRTTQNPNLLVDDDRLYCIDHGSVALFEHGPRDAELSRGARYVGSHVLVEQATRLLELGNGLRAALDDTVIERTLAEVPPGWLDIDAARAVLRARIAHTMDWLADAIVARANRSA